MAAARALRVLRLAPTLPPKSRRVVYFASSIRGGVHVARHPAAPAVSARASSTSCHRRWAGRNASGDERERSRNVSVVRSFGSGGDTEGAARKSDSDLERAPALDNGRRVLVYEGPFASLTLKLKRISLMSAGIAIFGLPGLSIAFGSAQSVPASGQLAIIATAGAAAVGSTALLGYCFSPYVHTLEVLPPKEGVDDGAAGNPSMDGSLARIVTRDVLARRVETVFDPSRDVSPPPSGSSRPFCNFVARGLPMYVHPELIRDYGLRVQLVGEEPQQVGAEERNREKKEEDEFL